VPGLRACPLHKRCSQASTAAAAQRLLITVTVPWYHVVRETRLGEVLRTPKVGCTGWHQGRFHRDNALCSKLQLNDRVSKLLSCKFTLF
jgi:hypothetical protein